MNDCRVLIIEDDADTRESLATALQEGGFIVAQAPDGDSALAKFRTGESFDVALLDVHLPGPSTEEMLARLQAEGTRVIILSADGSARVIGFARKAKLLRKPMDLDELEAAVKEACAA